MTAIWHALVWAYSALATVPVIPFLLIYFILVTRGGDKKQAIKVSMDVTTLFLIGIVSSLLNKQGTSFGPYIILLFMLIAAGLIGGAQNRIKGRVDGRRLVRAIWRLSFFILTFLYVALMLVELAKLAFGSSA